jgi:hypothetical protein
MGIRHLSTGLCLVLIFVLSLWYAAAPLPSVQAAERNWLRVQYDPDVPAQTRVHVEAAIDLVADMLTEYKLPLRNAITVLVTADQATYEKLLQQYGYSAEESRKTAQFSAGVSLGNRPIILLKGTAALQTKRDEVYRVLPHEVFHQVQRQFGRQTTASWMVEAAPELFQVIVREKSGLEKADSALAKTALRVFAAKSIPSAQQLMTPKYADFSVLAQQGYPVYQMSLLMLHHLTGPDFEAVLQYYRLLNQGMSADKAFVALFRRPQAFFAAEMDQYFAKLRENKPKSMQSR